MRMSWRLTDDCAGGNAPLRGRWTSSPDPWSPNFTPISEKPYGSHTRHRQQHRHRPGNRIALARNGTRFFAGLRSPNTATELKDRIAAEALPVEIVQLDITDGDSVGDAVGTVMDSAGRIDALVNNAGIGGARGRGNPAGGST